MGWDLVEREGLSPYGVVLGGLRYLCQGSKGPEVRCTNHQAAQPSMLPITGT